MIGSPMAEPFLVSFSLEPGVSMLRATLPNGASFLIAPHEVHGKLGQNLDLYRQAVTPKSTAWNIKAVAEGRAEGISPENKSRAKTLVRRAAQDALDNLEIEL
jgi:hypothetical protein